MESENALALDYFKENQISFEWIAVSYTHLTYPKADEKEIEFVFDYEKELETCTIMQDKRWLGEASQLNTEGYGGMLCATWLDRPLSIAGRVLVSEGNSIVTKLLNIDRDLFCLLYTSRDCS